MRFWSLCGFVAFCALFRSFASALHLRHRSGRANSWATTLLDNGAVTDSLFPILHERLGSNLPADLQLLRDSAPQKDKKAADATAFDVNVRRHIGNLKVMTFNLRSSLHADDVGIRDWEVRKIVIADILAIYRPHIIAVQEGTPEMLSFLSSAVPGYAVAPHVAQDGRLEGNTNGVLYNASALHIVASTQFWVKNASILAQPESSTAEAVPDVTEAPSEFSTEDMAQTEVTPNEEDRFVEPDDFDVPNETTRPFGGDESKAASNADAQDNANNDAKPTNAEIDAAGQAGAVSGAIAGASAAVKAFDAALQPSRVSTAPGTGSLDKEHAIEDVDGGGTEDETTEAVPDAEPSGSGSRDKEHVIEDVDGGGTAGETTEAMPDEEPSGAGSRDKEHVIEDVDGGGTEDETTEAVPDEEPVDALATPPSNNPAAPTESAFGQYINGIYVTFTVMCVKPTCAIYVGVIDVALSRSIAYDSRAMSYFGDQLQKFVHTKCDDIFCVVVGDFGRSKVDNPLYQQLTSAKAMGLQDAWTSSSMHMGKARLSYNAWRTADDVDVAATSLPVSSSLFQDWILYHEGNATVEVPSTSILSHQFAPAGMAKDFVVSDHFPVMAYFSVLAEERDHSAAAQKGNTGWDWGIGGIVSASHTGLSPVQESGVNIPVLSIPPLPLLAQQRLPKLKRGGAGGNAKEQQVLASVDSFMKNATSQMDEQLAELDAELTADSADSGIDSDRMVTTTASVSK